jgi:hypothetical protein
MAVYHHDAQHGVDLRDPLRDLIRRQFVRFGVDDLSRQALLADKGGHQAGPNGIFDGR